MNTTMTAKNSFQEGLIMDFSPTTTRADCMTSALNATLLTFNGNEMSLQNDMGNGRVETAFLPEGYTPVGTCEFGDIIYIISYNPFINKALIGCFPSPERNISSEELHDPDVSIDASDFLILDKDKNPTGELKNTSVKKILFDTMHSGDQYVIYYKDLDTKYISDFGNTDHVKGRFPKFVKINVVSIEDSGKITYLDSSLKWYTNDYYLNVLNEKVENEKADIDSYQSLVSSAYNTFASKVPGKLALLFELERIDSFNVSWECYQINNNKYVLYWNFNWKTNHNDVNIKKVLLDYESGEGIDFILTVSDLPAVPDAYTINRHYLPERNYKYEEYKNTHCFDAVIETYKNYKQIKRVESINDENEFKIELGQYYVDSSSESVKITDSIVNNYFNFPVIRRGFHCTIDPTKNCIFKYTLTPCMPYGRLDDLAVSGYIDFSKVGKENINLHTWKYYVKDNQISLTYGLDAQVPNGQEISNIRLEFYDNQGLAAVHNVPNKTSYNGTFTNLFKLGNWDSALTNTIGKEKHYHTNGVYLTKSQITENEYSLYFTSNATHLYKNNKDKYVPLSLENGIIWGTHYYDPSTKKYVPAEKTDVINETDDNKRIYYNDCGIIYNNCLYLVKIIIEYGYSNSSTKESKSFERWLWTSKIFNNNYYGTLDFINLQPKLLLDVNGNYQGILNNWNYKNTEEIKNNNNNVTLLHQGLSANIAELNSNSNPNVELKLSVGFVDNYGIFNLNKDSNELDDIEVIITEGNDNILNFPELPEVKYANNQTNLLESIFPITTTSDYKKPDNNSELYQSSESYKDFKDYTKLKINLPKYDNVKLNLSVSNDNLLFGNAAVAKNTINFNTIEYNYEILPLEIPDNLSNNVWFSQPFNDINDHFRIYVERIVETTYVTTRCQVKPINDDFAHINFPKYTNQILCNEISIENITDSFQDNDKYEWELLLEFNEGKLYYNNLGTYRVDWYFDGSIIDCTYHTINNTVTYIKIPTITYFENTSNLNLQTEIIKDNKEFIQYDGENFEIGKEYLVELSDEWSENKHPKNANISIYTTYLHIKDENDENKIYVIADKLINWISTNLVKLLYNRYFIELEPNSYRMSAIPKTILKYSDDKYEFHELELISFSNDIVEINSKGYYAFCLTDDIKEFKLYVTTERTHTAKNTKYETSVYENTNRDILEFKNEYYYKYSVKDLLNEIPITFELNSIKYSKYYFTTTSKQHTVKIQTLKSLLINKDDLNNYNLVLASKSKDNISNMPYFRYGIALGFANTSGKPSYILRNVLKLVNNDDELNISISEGNEYWSSNTLTQTGFIDHPYDQEADISYKQIAKDSQQYWLFNNESAGNKQIKPPFFPICLGYVMNKRAGYSDGDRKYEWTRNGVTMKLANFYTGSNCILNGSLAIFDNHNIYIQDDWIKNNVSLNAKKVLTFLRNIYYVDTETEAQRITYVPNNYVYLDDNYSIYTKNIIINVEYNKSKVNSLLLFNNGIYLDYLDLVKLSASLSNSNILSDSNINFKLQSISKNIPFQFKQDYKTPYINLNDVNINEREVLINPENEINKNINILLERGALYGYDGESIKPLSHIKTMNYYPDSTYKYDNGKLIINQGQINEKLDVSALTNYSIFELKKEDSHDKLVYNGGELLIPSAKTYNMMLSKEGNMEIGIIGFENELKFFNEIK